MTSVNGAKGVYRPDGTANLIIEAVYGSSTTIWNSRVVDTGKSRDNYYRKQTPPGYVRNGSESLELSASIPQL